MRQLTENTDSLPKAILKEQETSRDRRDDRDTRDLRDLGDKHI